MTLRGSKLTMAVGGVKLLVGVIALIMAGGGAMSVESEDTEDRTKREVTGAAAAMSCPGSGSTYYQDASDCSRYFMCSNDQVMTFTCPLGQVFNPDLLVCGNFAPPQGCLVRSGTTSYSTQQTFVCRVPTGQFQDPTDCSGYYRCYNYQVTRLRCPYPQQFDPVYSMCRPGANPTGCYSARTPPPAAVVRQGTFFCPANGEYSYPGDCSRFWRCDNGRPTLMSCPSGLQFNSARGYCDWPAYSNCVPTSG